MIRDDDVPADANLSHQNGSYMPIRYWLQYADRTVAPLRRSATGSYMPITNWLLYGGR